jgi:uncharacterized membrane protein
MKDQSNRTDSIDLLRGFIMMTMALDHASVMIGRKHFSEFWGIDFSGYPSFDWWLTRFVSHLCAPGFFFLMGMSIFLFAQNRLHSGWDNKQIRKYFLKRGGLIWVFMLFLEFPAWGLSIYAKAREEAITSSIHLPGLLPEGAFFMPTSVLYGLGACMMIGAFLWQLRNWQLLLITIGSFGISYWYISNSNPLAMFMAVEHFFIVPGGSPGALVTYPIIPWLGLTTFGIYWAQLLQKKPKQIYKLSLITGLTFILICVVLRWIEWGNFEIANNDDWINFFTLVKYPPSIAFALMTCGINLVLFFFFSIIASKTWLKPVKVFGQTAMFFYITHLFFYAILSFAFPKGCDIKVMYTVWALGLVVLYFISNWFLQFKKSKPKNSLWRMV